MHHLKTKNRESQHAPDPSVEELIRNLKPRRRWWLYIPLGILLLAALAVVVALFTIRFIYDGRAAAYDVTEVEKMESATIVYDRNGTIIGNIFIQNRDAVPLDRIAFTLQQAVIAAEDARFPNHRGADYIRIVGAALRNLRAKRIAQGGSTITQQLARNSFGLRERSFERKLVEIFLAARIEKVYSKSQILEFYLNRIYFGSGFYGAEAAARGYFGKAAADLSLSDAALLAGLIKSPNNLSPWSNRRASIRERDFVLRRMRELGMISAAQLETALAEEPSVRGRRRSRGGGQGYAMEFIRQKVIAEVGFEGAMSGGYRVFTSIDSDLQQMAEETLRARLAEVEARPGFTHQTYPEFEKDYQGYLARTRLLSDEELSDLPAPAPTYLQGALIAISNADGGVLALVGGRDFTHSEFNRAIQARRPLGTAFTPIVFAAGFANGLFPGTLFEDSALDNRQVMIGGTTGILGEWGAERFDNRYEGKIPARHVLVKGKNAATVRVGAAVGLARVIDFARRAGIQSPLREFSATHLGSSEMRLSELVLAFSMFPSEGWRAQEVHVVKRILAKDGALVFRHTPTRVQVMPAGPAYQVHSALADALDWGTAEKATTRFGLRRMAAGGKTGTAYDFTDVCFVGYNSEITCGVWAGFDKPRTIYRGAFSSDIALPVWVDFMNASTERFRPQAISQPLSLRKVEVSLTTGLIGPDVLPGASSAGVALPSGNTYFEFATEEQVPIGSDLERGLVAAQPPTPEGEWPRATLAIDLSAVPPIEIQSPTILGEDPYGSLTPKQFREMSAAAVQAQAGDEEEDEVRRASRVRPLDDPREQPVTLNVPPPEPIIF